MITIGITGTIGAGKGTIVDFLVATKGFKHFSARAFLLEEIAKRGLPPTRDSMWLVAQDFRKNYSPGYLMEQLAKQRKEHQGNAVIEAQRALAEIEILRKELPNFYMFAITADPKIRYERIVARKSTTDHISFEKFIEDENRENQNPEPWSGKVLACIEVSDFVFENNGSVEELHEKVEAVLKKLA